MTLRTQVDPYVLVGLLADLPSPAAIAQGTLFHAEDTGDCRVLVINPLSGVRYWDDFCGTSGSSGTVPIDSFAVKFSGSTSGSTPAVPQFLGDAGVASASTTALNYRFSAARTILGLIGRINANNGAIVTITVLVNSIAVITLTPTGPNVNFDSGATAIPVPAGSTVDVEILAAASAQTAGVVATLKMA